MMTKPRPQHSVEHGMFVRSYGADDAVTTLLFLHGLGESGYCFEPLVQHVALKPMRHLVIDLPGYGRSAWTDEPLSLEKIADHLARWLRERGAPPVVVVAHSMGGVLATYLAERHPDVVAAVVNVEGNVSIGDCHFSSQALGQTMEQFLQSGIAEIRQRVLEGSRSDVALRRYYPSLCFGDPRCFYRHAHELVEVSKREEMATRLAALDCPVRYIAGVPDGAAARSLELLDDAGIAVTRISPAGHWPFIDRPDEFADQLAEAVTAKNLAKDR